MFGFLNPASRNAGAGRIDPKDAVARAASGELTVIDVRDISELKSSGKANWNRSKPRNQRFTSLRKTPHQFARYVVVGSRVITRNAVAVARRIIWIAGTTWVDAPPTPAVANHIGVERAFLGADDREPDGQATESITHDRHLHFNTQHSSLINRHGSRKSSDE